MCHDHRKTCLETSTRKPYQSCRHNYTCNSASGRGEGGGVIYETYNKQDEIKEKKMEKKEKINLFTRLVVTRCDVLDMKKYCSLYRGRMGHLIKCL